LSIIVNNNRLSVPSSNSTERPPLTTVVVEAGTVLAPVAAMRDRIELSPVQCVQ
jgi:hypothetical protein